MNLNLLHHDVNVINDVKTSLRKIVFSEPLQNQTHLEMIHTLPTNNILYVALKHTTSPNLSHTILDSLANSTDYIPYYGAFVFDDVLDVNVTVDWNDVLYLIEAIQIKQKKVI